MLALSAVALATSAAADAAIRTWPGPAPCNTTLQACIVGADAGDAVEVASNGTIVESWWMSEEEHGPAMRAER
jgi:hypothetical protein